MESRRIQMKKVKLTVTILLFAMLSMGTIFASGESEKVDENDKVDIVFYHQKTEVQTGFEELADAFNAENSDYNVIIEINEIGRKEKFASGNPPSMMYSLDFSSMQLKDYLDNDLIIPVEDWDLFDSVLPEFKERLYFPDGHIYGVPILTAGKGIMYNTELFDKAGITKLPTTTTELWDACEKLEAIGVTPFVGGHQDKWTINQNLWRVFFCQNTDPSFTQKRINGEVKFADELIPKWTNWLDSYMKYSDERMIEINWPTALGDLLKEDAAMIINGPWTVQSLNEMDPTIGAKFKMIADITTEDPDRNVLVEDVDLFMLVVNVDAEQVAGSKEFLTWIVTDEKAKSIFQESINCPNPIGIEISGTAVDEDIMEQINRGDSVFASVGLDVPAGWESEMGSLTQQYIIGEITAQEFGVEADKAWDTLYSK
jgi:raffinose/stachyose/melibiose transport system substrate-binding protein